MKNLINVSENLEYSWTNNRCVYNIHRKLNLEHTGKIYCVYCQYNRNENRKSNHYGGWDSEKIKYPSWKLSTSNKKQWMGKEKQLRIMCDKKYRWYNNIPEFYYYFKFKSQYK